MCTNLPLCVTTLLVKGHQLNTHQSIQSCLWLVFSAKQLSFYENSTQNSYYINFKLTMRIRDIKICIAMQLQCLLRQGSSWLSQCACAMKCLELKPTTISSQLYSQCVQQVSQLLLAFMPLFVEAIHAVRAALWHSGEQTQNTHIHKSFCMYTQQSTLSVEGNQVAYAVADPGK